MPPRYGEGTCDKCPPALPAVETRTQDPVSQQCYGVVHIFEHDAQVCECGRKGQFADLGEPTPRVDLEAVKKTLAIYNEDVPCSWTPWQDAREELLNEVLPALIQEVIAWRKRAKEEVDE